jgi:hypothetical protein
MKTATAPSKRVNWRQFFSKLVRGDSFTLGESASKSARASADKYGIRLHITKATPEKYRCTVIDTDRRLDEKEVILSVFKSLPVEQLRAIFLAANQAGIIKK